MRVVRKRYRPDYKNAERRYDRYGEFRLIVRAEGYVMFRRRGRAVRVMSEADWDKLAREPVSTIPQNRY